MERPHAMAGEMREAVLGLRQKHPGWGPRKLKVVLERRREAVPAASTIGELLRREGLVHRRRRRRYGTAAGSEPLAHAVAANDVWSIDYKGWFRTGDGQRFEPLTITDNASRYLLRLTAMPGIEQKRVRAVMEAAFREYGLPKAIRSDNGSPFVTGAPGGLSELSIWWMRLGIRHERIEPDEPQQNGRHERFHRKCAITESSGAGHYNNESSCGMSGSSMKNGRMRRCGWGRRPGRIGHRKGTIRQGSRRWSATLPTTSGG